MGNCHTSYSSMMQAAVGGTAVKLKQQHHNLSTVVTLCTAIGSGQPRVTVKLVTAREVTGQQNTFSPSHQQDDH
eukprot:21378-Heterococcus_DN1.PRE.1